MIENELNEWVADNLSNALHWSDFGLMVIPVEPGSTQAAVKQFPTECDREFVERHWAKHPEHEVGFVVGDDLFVFSAASPKALSALQQFEEAFGCVPALGISTPVGVEHHYWRSKQNHFPANVEGEHVDRIAMKTGKTIVLLPPYGGRSVTHNTASSYSDFTQVSQEFVDVVTQYNASLPEPVTAPRVEPEADMVVLAAPQAIEPSIRPEGDPDKAGEPGEGGELQNVATAVSRLDEAGEGGEPGDFPRLIPTATATAFAALTTFTDPPLRENCPDAPLMILTPADTKPLVAAPEKGGEAGEGGVPSDVSASIAASTSIVQTPASLGVSAGDTPIVPAPTDEADDVLTPKALENPVVTALKANRLYITPLGSGLHELTCPWVHEHPEGSNINATYAEPEDRNLTGVFHCRHAHADKHSTKDLLTKLDVTKLAARHKPLIRVVEGDMHRVIDAAETVLAAQGNHYQAGGMIVSVSTDPGSGDPSIAPTNLQALTRSLSEAASFEKFSIRNGWVPSDPPTRHTGLLHRSQSFAHLPALVGVARQPYFRANGELVTQPGYDQVSRRFGVFDPRQFVVPKDPSKESALASLAMLEELVGEFRFAHDTDRSASFSAMLTGVVRPSLPYAPLFHAMAAVYGSGKSYLCETIVPFAGPAPSLKISFPPTSEEATKAIMAVLVKNPAVVEFDDMTTDLEPHGIINRMLTTEALTDRILGYSKTATVSTRTLFLSSGNNVGPARDLLRRVITIKLDPRCATPATIAYQGNPVEQVRKNRGAYVSAALTIIQAWKAAGSPRANVSSIATYGGEWADYCRHPLIWLGLPDPATSLLDQIQADPDGDALGVLLSEWFKAFGSTPTTVREVVKVTTHGYQDLKEAICEFPVIERGEVNHSKLGWMLKKNVNRIVGGLKFVEAQADGRKAWAVVLVK